MRRAAIGLTGDAGAGKSRILAWLAEQGAWCRDADAVVRELLAGDAGLVKAVIEKFGSDIVAADDGGIDRRKLADRVFGHEGALEELEAIVHPRVTEVLSRWLDEGRRAEPEPPALAIEAIKLLEGGLDRSLSLDAVWLIACDPAVRRQRLAERGWSVPEARRREAALAPRLWRLERADEVIDTSTDWPATVAQLGAAWYRLRTRERRTPSQ